MNDTELFAKASKAGYDYRALYGKFPDKIGIHYKRLGTFRRFIIFLEQNPIPAVVEQLDKAMEGITVRQHQTMVEPVVGADIEWDEVYVSAPGWTQKVLPSKFLATMAKEFE